MIDTWETNNAKLITWINNSVEHVITQFWVIPRNIPKNNKNKIKGAGVEKKNNVEILDVFESFVVPLFCPEMNGNAD